MMVPTTTRSVESVREELRQIHQRANVLGATETDESTAALLHKALSITSWLDRELTDLQDPTIDLGLKAVRDLMTAYDSVSEFQRVTR